MSHREINPHAMSVEDRLRLIEELWLSIVKDAKHGDARAAEALDFNRPLKPELLAEFERRADELERDPSKGVRWEDLRKELRRKYG